MGYIDGMDIQDKNAEQVLIIVGRTSKWVRTNLAHLEGLYYRDKRRLWFRPEAVEILVELSNKQSRTGGLCEGQNGKKVKVKRARVVPPATKICNKCGEEKGVEISVEVQKLWMDCMVIVSSATILCSMRMYVGG